MKFNDEYDSEQHMDLVGKYMPGKGKKSLLHMLIIRFEDISSSSLDDCLQ